MTAQKFNAPSGFIPYSGAPVSVVEDATGATFWAMSGRYKGGWFGMHVFRQLGTDVAERVPLTLDMESRGVIQPDGYVSGMAGGTPWRVAVPGFQVRTATTASRVTIPASAIPNGGKPYTSNEDIGIVGTRDPLFYLRFNKLVDMIRPLIVIE